MKRVLALLMIMGLIFVPASFAQQAVEGDITSDTTWSGDVLLKGAVFVQSGATLTIEKGVTVFGEKATIGTLIIAQGAKLNINGTEDEPVVFTSDQGANAQRADWGGIIINGYATINKEGGIGEGEGDTGQYGCSGAECNDKDNSGTMQYFRVEFAGIEFSPENELNGIALQGVGSGTTLDHFQVHANKDDGIEMFGGTVDWKYGILTECADDSIDWTEGWRGAVQFAVVQQKADDADQGLECDNLGKDPSATPRANPDMYNLTVIGDPSTTYGDESDIGVLLRAGTAVNLRNSIIMGFKEAGVDIDDEETYAVAQGNRAEELIVDNCIVFNNNPNFSEDAEEEFQAPFTPKTYFTETMQNNKEVDPKLNDPYNLTDPDFRPGDGSPATDGTVTVASPPSGNTFIESTTYIGAVDPEDDWTRKPWTRFGTAPWTEGDDDDDTADDDDDTADDDDDTPDDDDDDDSGDDCPLIVVMGAGNPQLDVLRNFRDTVLAQTATGALYTELYYQYADEVIAIISADKALLSASASVITKVMPIVEAALANKNTTLDDDLAKDMIGILDKISAQAGIGLKIAIFKAKMDLKGGNLPL